MVSLGGCGSTAVCGTQCGPPYELSVIFQPGTTLAAAQQLLTACTDGDPVVIRVGPLRDNGDGTSQATIYTKVLGESPRTAGLLTCLHNSTRGVDAGWGA